MTYVDQKPTPTAEQLQRAKELREDSQRCLQSAEESFQRSDTDGFLSQWASTIQAQKNDANARLLEEAGGYAKFPVLVYEGRVVAEKVYEFADKFAPSWSGATIYRWKLPADLADKLGRKWIPQGSKSKIQKQLGLTEEYRWFPAVAIITTGNRKSTGLAGAANAYVTVVKRGEEE